jgi:hypothetical protein
MAAATRLLAVLCGSGLLGLGTGLAVLPNFETFARAATGLWAGAASRWSRHPAALGRDALEVSGFAGLAPFVLSATATPTQQNVEEVMRSCGGAVQGVKEFTPGALPLPPFEVELEASPAVEASAASASAASVQAASETSGLYLNRADDGFCSFNDGSWCCATSDGFEASLQHGPFARRRFSVKLAPDGSGQLEYVEVALETKLHLASGGGGAAMGGLSAWDEASAAEDAAAAVEAQVAVEIAELLAGERLNLAVDAEVWPGGAMESTVSATRHSSPAPTAWVAARAQWALAEAPLAIGSALLPELGEWDALLPAMAYVRCNPNQGTLELVSLLPGGRKMLTRTLDVSSVAAEAAEAPGSSDSSASNGGSSVPPREPAAAVRLASLVLRTATPLDPADAERGWDWDDDEQTVEEHGHEQSEDNEEQGHENGRKHGHGEEHGEEHGHEHGEEHGH